MNKTKLRKALETMPQKELARLVLDIYDAYPDVKENLDARFAEDKNAVLNDALEKYKAIIRNEYFPVKGEEKCRVSVCKKAISDFKKLDPAPTDVADLMVFFVEQGCQFTNQYGDMWEAFYTSFENNYRAALDYVFKNHLEDVFKDRFRECLNLTADCGWGFNDTLGDFYYEYYQNEQDG